MGLMELTGERDGPPLRVPVPLIDFMTGMYAAQSVLAALWQAERTGTGRPSRLRAARLGRDAHEHGRAVLPERRVRAQPDRHRELPARAERRVRGGGRRARPGDRAARGPLGGAVRGARPAGWLEDPRFAGNDARLANRELVNERIAEVIATAPADEWVERINGRAGCASACAARRRVARPAARRTRAGRRARRRPVRLPAAGRLARAPGRGCVPGRRSASTPTRCSRSSSGTRIAARETVPPAASAFFARAASTARPCGELRGFRREPEAEFLSPRPARSSSCTRLRALQLRHAGASREARVPATPAGTRALRARRRALMRVPRSAAEDRGAGARRAGRRQRVLLRALRVLVGLEERLAEAVVDVRPPRSPRSRAARRRAARVLVGDRARARACTARAPSWPGRRARGRGPGRCGRSTMSCVGKTVTRCPNSPEKL